MEPLTALTFFAPMLVDAGKALVNKYIGPSTPPAPTVDELLKLSEAELKRFQAMNQQGGDSYPWVEAVIKLQRPVVALVALSAWAYTVTLGTPSEAVNNFAGVVGFYLFGDRTLFYIRSGK
jgi:hypothetical protein